MLRNLLPPAAVVAFLLVVYGTDAIWFLMPVGPLLWLAGNFWLAREPRRRGVVVVLFRR